MYVYTYIACINSDLLLYVIRPTADALLLSKLFRLPLRARLVDSKIRFTQFVACVQHAQEAEVCFQMLYEHTQLRRDDHHLCGRYAVHDGLLNRKYSEQDGNAGRILTHPIQHRFAWSRQTQSRRNFGWLPGGGEKKKRRSRLR